MSDQLRDAPFAFSDLLTATCGHGIGFSVSGTEIRYACLVCRITFDQTDEGHRALREHEMGHGFGNVAHLSELDGKTLRIVTWAVHRPGLFDTDHIRPEIWGIDDAQGLAYCLSNAYQGDTVWKWKITTATTPSDGPLRMLNALASPSHG